MNEYRLMQLLFLFPTFFEIRGETWVQFAAGKRAPQDSDWRRDSKKIAVLVPGGTPIGNALRAWCYEQRPSTGGIHLRG